MQKLFGYTICSAVFIMIFVSSCKTTEGDAVQLNFNLQKGKTYQYLMELSSEQEAGGQKLTSDMKQWYSLIVTDETVDRKTIRITYERLLMKMEGIEKPLLIDTDIPPKDLDSNDLGPLQKTADFFYAMKGKSYEFIMDSKGNIIEIKGARELMDSLITPKNSEFLTLFSDSAVKQNFQQAFKIFPDNPVKEGESWKKEFNQVIMGMNMNIVTTYTLNKFEESNAFLDVNSSLKMGPMEGEQTGTMVVDRNTGLVINALLEQKFKDRPMKNILKITGTEK